VLGFDRYKAQSNEADRYIKGVAQWLARFVRDPEVYITVSFPTYVGV